MERKDRVFAALMAVGFLVWAVFLAGKYIEKELHKQPNQPDQPLPLEMAQESVIAEKTPMWEEEEAEATMPAPEADVHLPQMPHPEMEPPVPKVPEQEQIPGEAMSEDVTRMPFVTVGYEYFDDALFIGDSRMEGIMEYGNLSNATFFADSGMSVFKLEQKALTVPGMGKASFEEVLKAKEYGKVYLMLGLNELGYKFEAVEKKYEEVLHKIRENQSEAVIYLCANLHVTEAHSGKDKIYNNENVNWVNGMIESLADEERCIYVDINEVFDDETGSLRKDYSSDSLHVYAKHYVEWVDWLCTKGVQKEQI